MKLKFLVKKNAVLLKKPTSKPSAHSSSPMGSDDWMISNPADQKLAMQMQKSQNSRRLIPVMWLKDGESKNVRFRYPRCITCIWVYSVKLQNGKFERVTVPKRGDVDLFRDQLHLKPSLKAIYEVIDIDGYADRKTGKVVKNTARFFVVSHKVHENLDKLADKLGGLDKRNVEITRTGEGTLTNYLFMPDSPTPMTPEMKKPELLRNKVRELFRPPTEAEQRAMLPNIVPNTY